MQLITCLELRIQGWRVPVLEAFTQFREERRAGRGQHWVVRVVIKGYWGDIQDWGWPGRLEVPWISKVRIMTAAYTYTVFTASQAWHQETYTHHLLSSSIHNKLDTIIRSIFLSGETSYMWSEWSNSLCWNSRSATSWLCDFGQAM